MIFLRWTLKLCIKLERYLQKIVSKNDSENEKGYIPLTPKIIKSENNNEYFNALNFALSQKDVKNIAVTGTYGAGKSTIIKSYMDEFKKGEFINVSLAGFDMHEKENVKDEKAKYQEVELSILQQILYKKNRDSLPDSRIDRILNRNFSHIWRVFFNSLKIIIPIGVILAMAFPDKAMSLMGVPSYLFEYLKNHPKVKPLIFICTSLLLIYFISDIASKIGVFDKKIKLNKVSLLSGEMDLGTGETSSLLNNCLDEIVYFFSRIKTYRIVIFEDLDRLKNPDIFVKLREINKIVNNNLSEDFPLRFIYAVRDDVFSGADARTKFFDFIIPVIPIMDNRNAYSLLNDKMKSNIPDGQDCLRGTAIYINDMRCLQNIINEFHIFSEVVDNKINKISLYSLIFYKNTFSQDYSLIDKKISILYKFIHSYRTLKLHNEYFNNLDAEVSSLTIKLNKSINETANTPEGIRKEIVHSFIPENLCSFVYFQETSNSYNFNNINPQQLIADEGSFLDLLSSGKKIHVGYGNGHNNQSSLITFERLSIKRGQN